MRIDKKTMHAPELDRDVTLYVLLPKSYDDSVARYPVLYMQDGHNLFYPEDSYSGETWKVEEAFMEDSTLPEVIVVGIDSAKDERRLDEYCPVPFEAYRDNGGKGDVYLDYLLGTIKPHIDDSYRSDPTDTAIMGSSMGGVISLYAAIRHPSIFKRAASLSGAFYVAPKSLASIVEAADFSALKKLYMDTGDQEDGVAPKEEYLHSNGTIAAIISEKVSPIRFRYEIIPGGTHEESAWAQRFAGIVRYIFKDDEER